MLLLFDPAEGSYVTVASRTESDSQAGVFKHVAICGTKVEGMSSKVVPYNYTDAQYNCG